MKRLVSILAIVTGSAVWIGISACNTAVLNTPTRSFDRPSDVALSCLLWNTKESPPTYEVHNIVDCNPDTAVANNIGSDMGLSTTPTLGPNPAVPFVVPVVTQSARGEVAFADTVQNKLIDLDPLKPSFGFLPVGDLPEHIRTSTDGCFAYTANTGSCDFGRVDINAAITNSQRVEVTGGGASDVDDLAIGSRRIKAWVPLADGSKRVLAARPAWIEMAPGFDGVPAVHGFDPGGTPGQCIGGTHKAWVAFPNCQLVAKISLEPTGGSTQPNADWSTAGRIEQAIQVTRTGATVVTDLSTISCAAECSSAIPAGSDLALPLPVDAGTAADAGSTIPIPTSQAAPTTLSVDTADSTLANPGGRLIIGDAYGERIDIIPLGPPADPTTPPADPTVGLGAPRKVQLEAGALGVTVVRVSPRSPAGKFLYAIARDGTVRVVDLDRELECETNLDPRFAGGGIDLQQTPLSNPALNPDPVPLARRLGCFPIGDPNDPVKPRRNSNARSPGITLTQGQLPTDVAFVHVALPPGNTDTSIAPVPAAPGLLVGDFAWIISSDGRAELIQIFDDCPQPNQQDLNTPTGPFAHGVCDLANVPIAVQQTELQLGHPQALLLDRLSHRLRGGHPRFVAPLTFSDTAGMARIADETDPVGISVPSTSIGDGGIADAGIAAGLPTFFGEDVPSVLITPPPSTTSLTATDIYPTRILRVIAPDDARNESWVALWEGIIPGTDRTLGHPFVDTDGIGKLTDSGGAWCARGVLAGDKLVIHGCIADSDCNQAQVKALDGGSFGHTPDAGQGHVGGINGYNNFKCVTDPNAPPDVFTGLCLVEDTIHNDNFWSDTCGELLRSQRKYRVVHARQNQSLDNGEGITDVLELAEIYEPEYLEQTKSCNVDTDCTNITVPASDGSTVLGSKCLQDSDGQNRCLIPCSTTDQRCGTDFECGTAQKTGDMRCMRAPINAALWKTCFPELLEYEIEAGDAFTFFGTVTPFTSDETSDPVTGECMVPPVTSVSQTSEFVRLRNSRIPLSPKDASGALLSCPAGMAPLDSIDVNKLPGSNVCSIDSITGSRVIHFENAVFNVAMQVPTEGFSTSLIVPPDGTSVSFTVVGGGGRLAANLGVDVQAQQPRYAAVAPDGQTVYVVDEGSSSAATGLRGQLLRLFTPTQSVDTLFVVR